MRNEELKIVVGRGSCGNAAGAGRVFDFFTEAGFVPTIAGCIGACYLEPIVELYDGARRVATYVRVDLEAAAEIVKYLENQNSSDDEYKISEADAAILFGQTRIALANCGIINPEEIEEYIARGGYEAAKAAIISGTAEEIIEEIKVSGLAGRGGAGFPTWFKWQACRNSPGGEKYIICNADEGDPGAFMDRAIIEGDPHAVIEGMIIGAFAIGSAHGIVYVRAEYPLAIHRLNIALEQARQKGFLGANIFNSGFNFDIRIKAGAGAFVCGEETALIASLEGERGMPRLKPPFPAQKGYKGKPSNINNVETFANVPWICRNGGAAFAAYGTENSRGTKVFALAGKVKNGGLVEVPMGATLNHVIFDLGGGIKSDKAFKAVQMGGPSGGCIPASLGETVIDYKSLAATGAIMGSGGMVVMDEDTCMVDLARFFLDFTCKESCGKCTHCRIGTKRMLEILERICAGGGRDGDIETLEELAESIREGSLCALGQTAPNPVLTTLKYFRDEYENHIVHKKCNAKSCRPLITYDIIAEKCVGCGLCLRNCPVWAISGEIRDIHIIWQNDCTKCGRCVASCPFHAIIVQ
ncbi:MAG: NADH-quinone oxidoreductase subunit NuoF [Clostridiales bacterium]|jgi:NADH-quinone oxidoreductase subunit F|nr:NADH-quinone oxidoreductase subunit NuoF [Clostridiales bacterium]